MKDEIIRMAREANLPSCLATHPVALERFAVLVAKEAERKASFDRAELWIKRINDAVLAEHEACAKFFEDHWREQWTDEQIVEALRARSQE